MKRIEFCERIQRAIYNGFPSDDANITIPLINSYLNDAIGFVAKINYKENLQLEGVGYLNNSFYSTFKGLTVDKSDTKNTYEVSLPAIPLGIGRNEGVSNVKLKDVNGNLLSKECVPLSNAQRSIFETMREIPNKIIYFYEGNILYFKSTNLLTLYKANVTLVSGGVNTGLQDDILVPDEYFGSIVDYLTKILLTEKNQKQDTSNDGVDNN